MYVLSFDIMNGKIKKMQNERNASYVVQEWVIRWVWAFSCAWHHACVFLVDPGDSQRYHRDRNEAEWDMPGVCKWESWFLAVTPWCYRQIPRLMFLALACPVEKSCLLRIDRSSLCGCTDFESATFSPCNVQYRNDRAQPNILFDKDRSKRIRTFRYLERGPPWAALICFFPA